ncbi:hypothetical protein Taro_049756 [Colocasia esculenta]|uniref:Retrotransposon gag domain-containing protein n=1 Tax=Colocasia esculenta TaxID=4460 RepID=A0A843XBW8_COLES|nr:hypothetical protein [Colocasia esculenta]
MMVLEYEARFVELSKFAPHIVADERRKAKKFVMGLKPSLRSKLVAFDHRTLDEALSAACRQESEEQGSLAVHVGDKGVDANLSVQQVICIEEWLVDRGMRGVAELREETSRRGAIRVGARGGLGVNRGIAGDSNAF